MMLQRENIRDAFWLRPDFLAAALILGTTLVRFWFIATAQLDLVQDEAQYWDWSRRLQLSYYSKGPLIAYIIGFWTWIFGDTELGVRFGAVLCSFLTQTVLYCGVSRLFKRPRTGVWMLVIMNTTPLFMASALLMTTDNPLLLCWVGALFSLHWSSLRSGRLPWLLLGLCLALGVLAKYMMLAFTVTALLYALGLARGRVLPPHFIRRLLLTLLLGMGAGMLPILIWNLQNDFVGLWHVGKLAGLSGHAPGPMLRFDRFPEYFASQIGLLTPWWLCFLLTGAWQALLVVFGHPSPAASGSPCSPDSPGSLGAAPAETSRDGKSPDVREAWLLAGAFWPIWGFFILWSFHAKIYANWSGVSYAGGIILAAFSFQSWFEKKRARQKSVPQVKAANWKERLRAVSRSPWLWPGLGAVLFVLLTFQNLLPLPGVINPTVRLKGWSDLGRELGDLKQNKFKDPERVFFFADTYDMSAALAFYAPDKPTSYCAFLDRRMNQYDLWPGPKAKKGWDALYVAKKFKDKLPPGLESMFERIERVHFQSRHRGHPARRFTILLCYGFNGVWPEAEKKVF